MKVLHHLTLNYLKLNKRKTLMTIIGIILSTALVCALGGLYTSFHQAFIDNAIYNTGYYHISADNLNENDYQKLNVNRQIKKIMRKYEIGHAYYSEYEGHYVSLYSFDDDYFKDYGIQLIEGKYPTNQSEVIISEAIARDLDLKLNESLSLDFGHWENEQLVDTKKSSYKIVGIGNRVADTGNHYAYTKNLKSDNFTMLMVLNNPKEYHKVIDTISNMNESAVVHDNGELLRWEAFAFSDSTIQSFILIFMIVVSIIMITSIYCIRNCFMISINEKKSIYGRLASVGATKKQLRRCVLDEALILAMIGIPIGIIGGIIADMVLIWIFMYLGGDSLNITISFKLSYYVLIAIVISFMTVYLSSFSAMNAAANVSVIENIRGSDYEIKVQKLKTPKIIGKLFHIGGVIAYKNLKRSKRKYRTTVISIVISVFSFITMYGFIQQSYVQGKNVYEVADYNLHLYNNNEYRDEELLKIKDLDEIDLFTSVYQCDNGYVKYNSDNLYIDFKALSHKDYLSLLNELNIDKNVGAILSRNDSEDTTFDEMLNQDFDIEYVVDEQIITDKIKIDYITSKVPQRIKQQFFGDYCIIVDKDKYPQYKFAINSITIHSNDIKHTLVYLHDNYAKADVIDFEAMARSNRNMILLISIFLYGFIGVIALIGVTNIFNTISSNMELRQKEFAMLISMGMDKKQFKHMIQLETIFYSLKSLFYGTILGIIGSYLIYLGYSSRSDITYMLPIKAIIISFIFVFLIISIIMNYSMHIIRKQNIIETIRKDNI